MKTKKCSRCSKDKPESKFGKRGKYLASWCNECRSESRKKPRHLWVKRPRKEKVAKRCVVCHTVFIPRKQDSEFCSKSCAREYPIGFRKVWKSGYVYIKVSNTKNAHVDWVKEHRHVMSKHIGRPLIKTEVVHHIDGDTTNNSIDNLVLTSQSTHRSKYHDNPENSICIVSGCKNKVRSRRLCSTHWKNWAGLCKPRHYIKELADLPPQGEEG